MKNKKHLSVSIGIPAYNEGKNLDAILEALINQKTHRIKINKIVVIASGCTDNTEAIAAEYSKKYPSVELICQKKRRGKAVAINAFLKRVTDDVVVIESADTVPNEDCIEQLCLPFLESADIGLTGGAPIPVNDPNTMTGYIVHTWWWFHRNIPRFGEIIAFRNVIDLISETTAVDEAYIQAKIVQQGFRAVHVDTAVVRNKGPETVRDLIKQRRRIFNGHSRLYQEEGVKIDSMTKSSLGLLFKYQTPTMLHSLWFYCGIAIEFYSRILGAYDSKIKNINPFVWDTAKSTKNLALEPSYEGNEDEDSVSGPTEEDVNNDLVS
jgi:cellulose synthase/poly-beta-1,6-N-acetylglucosamine synthase-like glycosyltransferase